MRLRRGTCDIVDRQTGGREPVLSIERQEVHVVSDAKFLIQWPAVGEGLFTGVVHAREVSASWREHLTVITGSHWNLTVSGWSNSTDVARASQGNWEAFVSFGSVRRYCVS